MSYILDALRKADAERERDPARGIHAQPAAGFPLPPANRSRAWVVWPATCAVAALAAAYAFWGRAPEVGASTARPAVPVGLSQGAPAAGAAVLPVATSVMPPPPAAVEHMVAKIVVAPHVAVTRAASPAAPAASTAATSAVAASAAPATRPAADRIVAVADLPPDVQHALPKLVISGGVHSENAAQRMLIVGGQVMTEGQELAPGVLLEQIRPRSAVLRFRGYRYSVAY
ncbi:general secretion pathway protein GspB [Ramlibacter sp.]|uniref:general secretion pathway protein GspB n=1 Tax=Ramlibacter sp. TaxID=1917967 RepID=UPI002612CC71|nr:general secretion pathway protein GspB [Ramlibacter sp.]MDB5958303.1 hypothetical protein [Ramlibacter sp.]